MKIKVKRINNNISLPCFIKKGDWVDLQLAEEVSMRCPYAKTMHRKGRNTENETRYRDVVFDHQLLHLGVAMQLPEGFEAVVLPRSSTFGRHGIIMANSQGVIDNSYHGNTDEWKFPAIALKNTTIEKGIAICQFRIQLSQKASFLQKLKWLFSSKIEFEEVSSLENENRGGFGSTDESNYKSN